MQKRIYFSLGLHNHQPVGNFDFVIERAYQMCYKSLIEFFYNYPKFPFNVHFSGYLLLWLENNHPEYFKILKTLSERGQVEILSGGFYEPILSIIPDKDKVLQVKKLNDYIYNKFGQRPKGMWLAERVWEPHLVKFIAEAGIEYVIVDDAHFLSVGLNEDDLFGYYLMEEEGYKLAVFPISMKLRYLIPFADPQETVEYLDKYATNEGNRIALLFDDGEKFGLWPDTYKTVYEEKWLERFLGKLEENFLLITPVNLYNYMKKYPPLGRIYLPTASYRELMEWVLFPEAQLNLEKLVEKLKNEGTWEIYAPFIKGGFWRNFLSKYDESNHMQKKMLYIRKKIDMVINDEFKNKALEELWQGQANDAYWHGIFGGLYLPHLRSAIYEHLIKAENFVDGDFKYNIFDFDCDGRDEIIIESSLFNLYFSPSYGGSLIEWDFKNKPFNLTNVLTRRREAYHEKLQKIEEDVSGKSIHERWTAKEKGLDQVLFYDRHRRVSFIEKFYEKEPAIDLLLRDNENLIIDTFYEKFDYTVKEEDNVFVCSFKKGFSDFELYKIFLIPKDKNEVEVFYRIINLKDENINLNFSWEINLNFLAPNHPDFYYFSTKTEKAPLNSIGVESINKWGISSGIGINLDCYLDMETKVYRYPIETVSLSEEGFERVYQGSDFIHFYHIALGPNQSWETRVKFIVY